MSTASEKGNALERAVEAIENRILGSSPTLRGNSFTIESKKILKVGGVHHEIDILVTVDGGGHGYVSVFVFECKNWKEAVGKNEIIVLSEKIDASSAMKGYFVAKSFTADARAQAAKDKRITLLVVTEHNAAETPVPIAVEHLMIKTGDPNVLLQKIEETPGAAQPFEMAGREVHLNGLPIDLVKYVKDLSTGACHEKAKQMKLGELPDGDYPATATIALKYSEGELMVGEIPLVGMKITTSFVATIIRPKLHVHFDVIGRGRSYQFEPIASPEGTFVYEFATKSS